MKINYNATGAKRKSLVAAISQELNVPIKYLGAPTFTYEVGDYHIDKSGVVTGPDNLDLEADLQGLHSFEAVDREYDNPDSYESGLGGMTATPSIEEVNDEADAWAERVMRRLKIDSENIPDYSNRGQYGGDCIPCFEVLQMDRREELGLGHTRRENWQGENGMQANDIPESYTYQAELSDPGYPDRMEVFSAKNDEDALRQAYEFCEGEVVLLEIFQLDEDYNIIHSVEITPPTDRLSIEIPLDGFTPEKLDNLKKLVNAKAPLLKVALGTDDLQIRTTADTLLFPWFRGTIDEVHTEAYAALVSLLCKTAIEKKRVTAKEKEPVENPKYAMRCFLLSLGFIGDKYKVARKILLSRLEGNSSWKASKKAETEVTDSE